MTYTDLLNFTKDNKNVLEELCQEAKLNKVSDVYLQEAETQLEKMKIILDGK